MTPRTWVTLTRSFCAHMRALGRCGLFVIAGQSLAIIGVPTDRQRFDPDNDNLASAS